ncbi:alpha/beta hydrolase [Spirosoma endophyticum]|uniref:Enterochelin esterase n=1 Tax=Spirosoma endophyticum TaxID=662367 RepID=A0A1I1MYT0_9BACT|nr:alpha/beta hydrolase-fold protein [Spirosoma endophyticum]SFC90325.1 Enterochelin esterase [Spirosoma endophyticum]
MADYLPALTSADPPTVTVRHDDSLVSVPLNRTVHLDIILPPGYEKSGATYPQERLPQERLPVLYLNDGQDLGRLHMTAVLDSLFEKKAIKPFVLVAIHAGDRIQEYGTAAQADYMNRGSKAGLYTDFVLTELLPYIKKHYRVSTDPAQSVFAGFSLGGLSAFDIVFHHPERFSRAGVFSGSFWWRSKSTEAGYRDETDRIMHDQVRKGTYHKHLKFWFETGTDDETSDRNNNGIIDSIDDTLDLIGELGKKGYQRDQIGQQHDIRYVEIKGGQHNQETWSQIMPDFLTWAFGK